MSGETMSPAELLEYLTWRADVCANAVKPKYEAARAAAAALIEREAALVKDVEALRETVGLFADDAQRYRHIREAASRDHQHYARRAFTVGIVDWSRNLSLYDAESRPEFWSSIDLIGEDLDAEIDAARAEASNG